VFQTLYELLKLSTHFTGCEVWVNSAEQGRQPFSRKTLTNVIIKNQNKEIDAPYKRIKQFFRYVFKIPATDKQTSRNICFAPKSYQGINIKT